ncbi:MAG: hypothetical protein ACOY3P_20240 [Planctomycetota bacterium]
MTTKQRSTLIEQQTVRGQYELWCTRAIIDHPQYGLFLLLQTYGGEESPRGGAYRWGMAIRLQSGDTLESLTQPGSWNDEATILQAAAAGYDDSRPVQPWENYYVERLYEEATAD